MAAATPTIGWMTVCSGDAAEFADAQAAYDATAAHLSKIAIDYGLPPSLEELDEEGREILASSDPSRRFRFEAPRPYKAGTLYLLLSPSPGLKRTRENFTLLLLGTKGACKADRSKKLHYLGVPFHRVESNFVAQGGDVTRGDGSGGESVYSGGTFKVDAEGLKVSPSYGSLCMASGKKDVNTSQFFLILSAAATALSKIRGKYSVFGQALLDSGQIDQATKRYLVDQNALDVDDIVRQGNAVFQRFNDLASPDGSPREKVWVSECGVL